MKYRTLGKTGFQVSEIGFGAWAIGGSWGEVKDDESLAALRRAGELGVNFFDTADVYGMGHSEQLVSDVRREILKREQKSPAEIFIATKAGRKLNPHIADKYTPEAIRGFIEDSLKNMELDVLDLVQLHCPPTDVYYNLELFEALDEMQKEGLIRYYGVSVEKVEEALKAIEFPGVATVQIIFNMFRQRPMELFFDEAKKRNVGIIVRVPLASGLLSGKMTKSTAFAKDDHRNFNRHGKAFDVGETFAGVPFEAGVEAVEEIRALLPAGMTMAQFALKWILQFDAVSSVIPGAKRPSQAEDNCKASDLPDLDSSTMTEIAGVYQNYIKRYVHQRW